MKDWLFWRNIKTCWDFDKESIQKRIWTWIFHFLNISYWWENHSLLRIHENTEYNEVLKFRYNTTYKIYWIFYWKYLFLYFNDHRNVRRTKELPRILKLLNKKDEKFEISLKKLFDLKLKKFFWNSNILEEIQKDLLNFTNLMYWQNEVYFQINLKKFKIDLNWKYSKLVK